MTLVDTLVDELDTYEVTGLRPVLIASHRPARRSGGGAHARRRLTRREERVACALEHAPLVGSDSYSEACHSKYVRPACAFSVRALKLTLLARVA